jgi:hypothetical protein
VVTVGGVGLDDGTKVRVLKPGEKAGEADATPAKDEATQTQPGKTQEPPK